MSKPLASLAAKIPMASQAAQSAPKGAMQAEELAVDRPGTEMDALVRRKKLQQTLTNLDASDLVLDQAAAVELKQTPAGDGGSVLLAQAQVAPEAPAPMGTTGSAAATSAAPAAAEVGAGSAWIAAAGMGLGLAALSTSNKTQTRSGSVIDGYLSGATVFIDVDGDVQLDSGEPSTVTDANGNFSLPVTPAGTLVATGGTDISTGLPFVGVLRAPGGSTVVTPLTALMSELMADGTTTAAQAQEKVLKSLGLGNLASTIDLTNYDPLKQSSGDATALAVQKANANVATLVSKLTSKLQSATNATDSQQDEIARDVYTELSGLLTQDALAADKIGTTAGLLVDNIGGRKRIGGQELTDAGRNTLKSDKTFLVESTQTLANDLKAVTVLNKIGDLQKAALTYTLQLLHFSDAEAGTLASKTAPYLAAMVDKFEDKYANSITLAGGDNIIPGPFLAAGTDAAILSIFNRITGSTVTGNMNVGAVDIALHNLIGVEASAIGNHEFDLGSNTWAASIKPTASYKGALFPHISANLDFSGDNDLKGSFVDTTALAGLEKAADYKGKLVPSAILEEGGEKIGLVGATTQILENISSPSGTKVKDNDSIKSDDLDLLAAQLQPVINDLISQGVNKIILMAHLQILGNELALAGKLSGVDIILAAGSNTRLGDADDRAVAFPGHAADFANTYPVQRTDKDGNTTVIVNTDNEFTYLGRLVVDFDASGKIITNSLTQNKAINGAYASTAENAAAAWGVSAADLNSTALADGTRGGNVKALTTAVQDVITVKDGIVYGQSSVYLEGERTQVRSQETNLGNLSADANTYVAQQALGSAAASTFVVSLKNGGGIRTQIGTISAPKSDGTVDKLPPDGGVSQLDVENSLRFNNQLMMFDTTAQGLKAILEHSVAAGTLQGRFPQLGGVSFSWDPDFAVGSRVSDIALVGDGYRINLYDNGVLLDSVPRSISVVTLSFLANGGDSYPIKANGENFRYVVKNLDGSYTLTSAVDEGLNLTVAASVPGGLTPLGEQAAFEAYMKAFHATTATAYNKADTPASGDTRIQNLNFRSEDVLDVPRLLNTSVDGLGNVLTLYFDQPLAANKPPSVDQFSVNNNGVKTIESIEVVNNQVILKLATNLDPAQPVRVSFNDNPTLNDVNTVQSRAGMDAPSFKDVAVVNKLSQTASLSESFALGSTLKLAGAEISAFDPASKRLFVTSTSGLQVVQVNNDLSMTLLGTINLGSNDLNSVAAKNGVVAVAVAAADSTKPGSVYFLDAGGTVTAPAMILGNVTVGSKPDMLTFSADGKKVLVANEGERNKADAADQEGSVSIIDLKAGPAAATVTTASFAAFNSKLAELRSSGVRLFAGQTGFETVTVAQDLEPEYISIAPDGLTAFVTLQENNAIGILDLRTGQFTDIVPLGLKSFYNLPFDGSDRDGAGSTTSVSLQTGRPVYGQYMPDSISSFTGADGKAYFLIANEGDDRDDFIASPETARVSTLNLDPTAFPTAADMKANSGIGRLTVSQAPGNKGDTDGDGDIDRILAYGARSFSILNADGVIVFDSGSHMEQFVAAGGIFNASSPASSGLFDDTRSDNKGPEPEGITIGQAGGKTLAFVGLERGGGGVMVYDVTNPTAVSFVQYLRNPADVSPEGLAFVSKESSPNGGDLLFVTNEISNTVSVFHNALAIGDVRFLAANADATDTFAFTVLKAISAGTSIGFSDRDYSQATGMPSTGESAFMWTADKAYGAGTVVTIQPVEGTGINPIADKGTVQGKGGGINDGGETIYAFLGNIAGLGNGTAGAISLNTLLASINVGGTAAGEVPTAIASTSASFAQDNARYNGAMDFTNINTFVTQLNNTANWATSDTTAFTLTNNSLFPAV